MKKLEWNLAILSLIRLGESSGHEGQKKKTNMPFSLFTLDKRRSRKDKAVRITASAVESGFFYNCTFCSNYDTFSVEGGYFVKLWTWPGYEIGIEAHSIALES